MIHISFLYRFVRKLWQTGMLHHHRWSNLLVSMATVSLSQPQAQGNSSLIFSATKSPTYLLPVGTSYCLVIVSLTMLILLD